MIAPPPIIYLGFLGLGFALEGLMPGAVLPGWAQWLGAVVIVAGVALMLSFELAFKRVEPTRTHTDRRRRSRPMGRTGTAATPPTWGWRSPTWGSRWRRKRRGSS